MPNYMVTIPYRVSKSRGKRFKISYEVDADDKQEALVIAKKRFNEFLSFSLASWIRTMFEDDVVVIKMEQGKLVPENLIDELCHSLGKESKEYRSTALNKLRELEDERAVPALLKTLTTCEEEEKLDVMVSLAACGSVKTAGELVALYGKETSSWVKASLVKLIGNLGGQRHLGFLETVLQDTDPRVRANAVEALEQVGGDEAFELVLRSVEDEDNRVRANSIRAIYRLKGLFLEEALRDMLHHPRDRMRMSAAFAAGEMSVPAVLEDLIKLLDDPHEGVRQHAVRALGKLRGLESLQALLEALSDFHQKGDEGLLTVTSECIIGHPAQDELPDMLIQALDRKSGLPMECVDDVLKEYLKKEKQRGQVRLGLRLKRWIKKLIA